MVNFKKLLGRRCPCPYCERDFKSFVLLGQHVKANHADKLSAAPLKLPERKPVFPDEITDTGWFLGEDIEEMIKVNRRAEPGKGTAQQTGIQFLGLKHITASGGHIAKITKVTTDKVDNFGNPYVVYFLMDGTKYSKGFKETSPSLIDLVDMFGEDEKKWAGKSVLINKTEDEDGTVKLTFKQAPQQK